MLLLFLTGFCCWLASLSELMGGINSSWGEMGLKATKPPLVLYWDKRETVNKHVNRETSTNVNKSVSGHGLTGQSRHCGPSSAASGCWTECPQGGWRRPGAWTLSYSSEMRETKNTTNQIHVRGLHCNFIFMVFRPHVRKRNIMVKVDSLHPKTRQLSTFHILPFLSVCT